MANRITLKELSKLLGVSISTVSKALNDSHEISPETKQRVREFAKLHNYQPNKIAVTLKSGKTKTIGVVIPSVRNYFFARVLYGIEKVIADSNYNIIISITRESLEKERQSILSLSNGLVDGFIMSASEETQFNQSFDHLKEAINQDKKIVMFDRVVRTIECDKVIVDDFEAVNDATKQLLEAGRKNIVLVSTIGNTSVGKSRINGYRNAVSNATVVEGNASELADKLKEVFNNREVDAIVALDEDASLEAMSVCKKLNIDVPDKISIVGYFSEKMAENFSPKLTTINQHGITIGKAAARMLLDKLNNANKTEEVSEIVKSSLSKRETTRF